MPASQAGRRGFESLRPLRLTASPSPGCTPGCTSQPVELVQVLKTTRAQRFWATVGLRAIWRDASSSASYASHRNWVSSRLGVKSPDPISLRREASAPPVEDDPVLVQRKWDKRRCSLS